MPHEIETTEAVKAEMEIVLNGGSSEMESATIPFRWFFNDKAIEGQPTHIFLMDQTAWQKKVEAEVGSRGYRTVAQIPHGSGFIQFISPGRHHITIMAVKPFTKKDSLIHCFLQKSTEDRYPFPLNQFGFVCKIELEVDVPEELFAQKPKSAFGLWFWNFVNRWHGTPARDECDFRRRIPLSVVCGSVYLLLKVLQYAVYAPIATLYLILARLATFVVGYRPEPLFYSVGTIWQWEFAPSDTTWNLRKWTNDSYSSYSIWVPRERDVDRTTRFMPITGIELVGWAFVVWGTEIVLSIGKSASPDWYMSVVTWWSILLLKGLLAVFLLSLVHVRIMDTAWYRTCRMWLERRAAFWYAWRSSRRARQSTEYAAKAVTKATRPKPVKPDLYFEWLRETSHVSKRPARLEIRELPAAFKAPVIHRFRVAAWDLKRRFCRPYPH